MRPFLTLLAATALLLAGCASDDVDEGDGPPTPTPTEPAQPEPTPEPEPTPGPSVPEGPVEVFNGTLSQAVPGGSGEAMFTVPEGHLQLVIAKTDGFVLRGTVSLTLTSPSGGETMLLDGSFVQDDDVGVALPGLTAPETWTVADAVAGDWTFTWEVQGEMSMPLRVAAE